MKNTVSSLWDLLHDAAPFVDDAKLQSRITEALDAGAEGDAEADDTCEHLRGAKITLTIYL